VEIASVKKPKLKYKIQYEWNEVGHNHRLKENLEKQRKDIQRKYTIINQKIIELEKEKKSHQESILKEYSLNFVQVNDKALEPELVTTPDRHMDHRSRFYPSPGLPSIEENHLEDDVTFTKGQINRNSYIPPASSMISPVGYSPDV
jgi:hypothetical protein